MPTRIYLIRHGATELTAEDRFAGSTQVSLYSEGRLQAAALAERLRSDELNAIYASSLDRTMETARLIGSHLPQRLVPVVDEA
jgi:probable phosphoglycerate mutase